MSDHAYPAAWAPDPLSMLIRADQVAMVYRLAPHNLAVSIVVAFFAWLLAWLTGVGAIIAIWFACTALIIAVRYLLVRRYQRAAPRPREAAAWGRRFIFGSFVMGTAWGVGGIMLFALGDESTRLFLAFILAGVAAVGAGALSALPRAYPAYLLPAILPFAVYLFQEGEPVHLAMAAAALGFVGLTLGVSARWTRSIEETLTLRFENLALLDGLSQSKSRLEKSNAHLKREIEVRSRAESVAREQADKLTMYVVQAPLAIIETDLEYRIVAWNPAAEALFAYRRCDVLGKSVFDLVFPEEARKTGKEFAAKLITARTSDTGLLRSVAHDGRIIVTEWHVSGLRNNSGAAVGFAAAVRDVTERYDIERLKNEFIASVSRELHGPLSALCAALGKLVESELPNSVAALVRNARENSERLAGLTKSVIDASQPGDRASDEEAQPVDLCLVVRRAVEAAHSPALRHDVNVALAEPLPEALVAADRGRLTKACSDLMDAGVRQTPEGGTIQVSLSVDEARVHLSIAGCKSAPPGSLRSRMVQPLSRSEAELFSHDGGLVLYAVRQTIEKWHGKLSFESYHNAGTTFHVELPRWLPEATSADTSAIQPIASPS